MAPGGGEREEEDVPGAVEMQCACQTGPHSFVYFFCLLLLLLKLIEFIEGAIFNSWKLIGHG